MDYTNQSNPKDRHMATNTKTSNHNHKVMHTTPNGSNTTPNITPKDSQMAPSNTTQKICTNNNHMVKQNPKQHPKPKDSRKAPQTNPLNNNHMVKNNKTKKTNQMKPQNKTSKKDQKPQTLNNNTIILQWNICGLQCRLSELEILIKEHNPLVISLQETMYKRHYSKDHFLNKNYKWYFKTNQKNHNTNGVCIAVRQDIPHNIIQTYSNLQAIAIRIKHPIKTIITSIYIPPKQHNISETEVKTEFNRLVEKLKSKHKTNIIITGDINAHHEIWGSQKTDTRGKTIIDTIIKNDMQVLNDGSPTRVEASNGTLTAIDLSITSQHLAFQLEWQTEKDPRGSDHLPITIKRYITDSNEMYTTKPKWIYKEANWTKFQKDIQKIIKRKKPDNVQDFTKAIINAARKNIPKTKSNRPTKRSLPWWNKEIANTIKQRKILMKRLLKIQNTNLKVKTLSKYNQLNSKARKLIAKAKKKSWKTFTKDIDLKTNSTDIWKKIHSINGNTRQTNITLKIKNKYTTNTKHIAEAMADQFYNTSATRNYKKSFKDKLSKLKKKALNDTPDGEPNHLQTNEETYNKEYSFEELTWALSTTKNTAEGEDEVGYPMLKNLPIGAKTILLDIINKVWEEGTIPPEWRTGLIIPLPKPNKDPHKTDNYRPITLTSCFGKLVEKMVNRRLITELEEKQLLDQRQHAFRKGKSVETYFNDLEKIIENALTEKKHIDIISLDLSKAYDRTWRRQIINNLQKWNIKGKMLTYITNFLEDRKFKVIIKNTASENKEQENGIPQGSVISVTLFLIAMQTIFDNIPNNVHIVVYADDITLIVTGRTPTYLRNRAQKTIKKVLRWAAGIGFEISAEKSCVMHICNYNHKKKIKNLIINNKQIKDSSSMKILGITIDKNLNFRQHIKNIAQKVQHRTTILKKLNTKNSRCNRNTLLKISKSYIKPIILYGSELYTRAGQEILTKITPKYNDIIRTASGVFKTSPINSILAESGQLPIKHIITEDIVNKATRIEEKTDDTNNPLIERAKKWFKDLTGENLPETAKCKDTSIRKWYTTKPNIDWYFGRKTKAGDNKDKVKQLFRNHMETKYKNHDKIYTDGSLKDESTGYGVSGENIEISEQLLKQCNIFSAEAYALLRAIKSAKTNNKKTIILTDSASCLKALEKGTSNHPWIKQIQKEITKKIVLCWIPGHCGIIGNDKADELANIGRKKTITQQKVPRRDTKKWCQDLLRCSWEGTWLRTDQKLRKIKNTTLKWNDQSKRKHQRILTRLRIGHTKLTHGHIFNKTKIKDKPKCQTSNIDLTIEHILTECKQYEDIRNKNNIIGSIREVLANDKERERNVINFTKDMKLTNDI